MNKLVNNFLAAFDLKLIYVGKKDERYVDFDDLHRIIWEEVKTNTMTSKERIFGLIEAVKYVTKHKIEGAIVECGVWRGGSMMAVAKTLNSVKDVNRQLYLYDTYDGMSEPTSDDATFTGKSAKALMIKSDKASSDVWAYSALDTVQQGMNSTGYPVNNIHYIQGKVEDTIPGNVPDKIALLRLDTDWYESTKHELIHLFPKLQKGGVLIIDDYGFWKGSRKATDEYIAETNTQILLCRMDSTGRIAIKQ
jgi:hypothetical protein